MPVPDGYKLDDPMSYDPKNPLAGTAAFLDDTKKTAHVTSRPAEQSVNAQDRRYVNVADVAPSVDSKEINVFHPEMMSKPVASHELTHVFQFSREPSVKFKPDVGGPSKMYEYGGVDGLLQARKQGKTVMDYGKEQQAKMVQDYQQQTSMAIQSGDGARLDKLNEAYEPFVKQLSGLPKETLAGRMDANAGSDIFTTMAQMVSPPKIDAHPAAPGVPAGVAGGILKPSPLLGGTQQTVNGHPLLGPILNSPNADKLINNPPRVLVDAMKTVSGDTKKQLQDQLTRTAAKYAKAGKPIELGPQVKTFLGPDNVRLIQAVGGASQRIGMDLKKTIEREPMMPKL